jgi:hypothetical protein
MAEVAISKNLFAEKSTNDRGVAASAGRIDRVEGSKRYAFDSN